METRDIVERLKVRLVPDEEHVMKPWDEMRRLVASGDKGSLPRDSYESVMEDIDEERQEAADEITRLRTEVKRLKEALREIAEHRPVYDYIGADEAGKISLNVPGSPYDRGKRDGAELLSARARKALEGGE